MKRMVMHLMLVHHHTLCQLHLSTELKVWRSYLCPGYPVTIPFAQSQFPRGADLPDSVRELVVHPNHITFYRGLAEGRTVEILRVEHVAQQVL
jgi:hypothetical protein